MELSHNEIARQKLMTEIDEEVNKVLREIKFDIKNDRQDNLYPFGLTKMFKNEDNESKIAQVELIFGSAFASKRLYYKLLPVVHRKKLLRYKDELWRRFDLHEEVFQENEEQGFWTIFRSGQYTAAYMVLNLKGNLNSFIVFGYIPRLHNLNGVFLLEDIINNLFQQKKNTNSSACIHCGTRVE